MNYAIDLMNVNTYVCLYFILMNVWLEESEKRMYVKELLQCVKYQGTGKHQLDIRKATASSLDSIIHVAMDWDQLNVASS